MTKTIEDMGILELQDYEEKVSISLLSAEQKSNIFKAIYKRRVALDLNNAMICYTEIGVDEDE